MSASSYANAEVSLADAVNAAYAHQQENRISEAQSNLARALDRRANQFLSGNPSFNIKYQTDSTGDDLGYREWEGGLELPIWWPGQRSVQRDEANRTAASAEALPLAKRLEVAGMVRELFWTLAVARASQGQAKHAYDSVLALEKDVKRRVEAGELPRSDLLLARKETLQRKDEMLQREGLALQAQLRYQQYTGLDETPGTEAEPLSNQADLTDQQPALALLSAEAEKAKSKRDRVASERRGSPSIWIGGKSVRDVSGADYNSALGIEATIPFGGKAQAAPALAEAEITLTEAVVNRDRARLELQTALTVAKQGVDYAKQALENATRNKALADESLQLNQKAFELGETDLVRLLRARSDALAADYNLEMRRLEIGQAAARLNQILGVIPQ